MIFKLEMGFDKEARRSAKYADAHLDYSCNRPHRRGRTWRDSVLN